MGYFNATCGATRVTTSGIVGDSGKPILVCGYGVEIGAAASPFLKNGTAASNTVAIRIGPCTANMGNINAFDPPVMFPGGLYVSFVTNVNAVTIFYIQESVTT